MSKIKRSKTIDLNPLYEIELVELPYHFTLKTHFQYLHLDPHQQHHIVPINTFLNSKGYNEVFIGKQLEE